jgi:creatinine amidohydrolase
MRDAWNRLGIGLMNYHELTARHLAALDRGRVLVVVPIAAVEQHGPHMPTGTDTILCTAIAEALERRLCEKILLTPTLWLGASAHHLRWGSTLDAGLSTYIETLCDLGRSLIRDGYRRLFFLNGHGGNIDPLRVALRSLQTEFPQTLLAGGSYWHAADDVIRQVLEGEHKFVGHACECETSLMLHLRPELVIQDQLHNAGRLVPDEIQGISIARDMRQRTAQGYTGRPDLASAEKGRTLFEGILLRLTELAEELLSQPLGLEHSEFLA